MNSNLKSVNIVGGFLFKRTINFLLEQKKFLNLFLGAHFLFLSKICAISFKFFSVIIRFGQFYSNSFKVMIHSSVMKIFIKNKNIISGFFFCKFGMAVSM